MGDCRIDHSSSVCCAFVQRQTPLRRQWRRLECALAIAATIYCCRLRSFFGSYERWEAIDISRLYANRSRHSLPIWSTFRQWLGGSVGLAKTYRGIVRRVRQGRGLVVRRYRHSLWCLCMERCLGPITRGTAGALLLSHFPSQVDREAWSKTKNAFFFNSSRTRTAFCFSRHCSKTMLHECVK